MYSANHQNKVLQSKSQSLLDVESGSPFNRLDTVSASSCIVGGCSEVVSFVMIRSIPWSRKASRKILSVVENWENQLILSFSLHLVCE